jgi:hypothetical protein
MSKETREKMGEVARTARVLLEHLDSDEPFFASAAEPLRDALREFEEHLYGTVAAVIAQDQASPTPGEVPADLPDVEPAPDDPEDIPF